MKTLHRSWIRRGVGASLGAWVFSVFFAGAAFAAPGHGPIRVGIFKSYGPQNYFHTNINTAGVKIAAMLANPDTANIGPDVVKPEGGFQVTTYGITGTSQTTTKEQEDAFVSALDSLDVVVFPSITNMGSVLGDSAQRNRFEAYAKTHGVVSIHSTTDSYGAWAAWDTLHGARFQNHPSSDRLATVHLDATESCDTTWQFLNRGLPDTARFLEEWFSFTTNADVIRSKTGLKTTVAIDEASYNGGMGGARVMGADHPLSWYRQLPEGGRFFYTAIGHRAQNYVGTGVGTTPEAAYFLRRQLYNAILWVAGVDTIAAASGAVSIRNGASENAAQLPDAARISVSGSTLAVSVLKDGAHTVEVRSLDGRLVQARRGEGRIVHTFAGLHPGTVYAVSVTTESGQRTTRMTVVK